MTYNVFSGTLNPTQSVSLPSPFLIHATASVSKLDSMR